MNTTPTPADARLAFARFAGEMAESFSFNRSIGQIYGLLYASDQPLSLEEIARMLSMSKGGASVNVRTLESWGAVRLVSINGNRRDYYEAETDLKGLVVRRLEEGLSKRLDMADARIASVLESAGGAGTPEPVRRRLTALKALAARGRKALKIVPHIVKLIER